MRAAWYRQQGPARDVLTVGELPDPLPGPGEVRVRVHASGINPTDLYARSGRRGSGMEFPLVVPHQDGAGVIDMVGPGVSTDRVGERTWVFKAQRQRPFGTAAEYVVVPVDRVAPLPDAYGFAEGACLGTPFRTAYQALTVVGPVEGTTVLVTGGAGAVGFFAVQLAEAAGARVIATVGRDDQRSLVVDAGASAVLDYRSEDVGAGVAELTGGRGVDLVIEGNLAANAALLERVVAPDGTVVVYGTNEPQASIPASWSIVSQVTYRFVYSYRMDDAPAVAAFARLAARRRVRFLPIRTFSLEEIVEAHEAVEAGNHGVRSVIELG